MKNKSGKIVMTLCVVISWLGLTWPLWDYYPRLVSFMVTVAFGVICGWVLGDIWELGENG